MRIGYIAGLCLFMVAGCVAPEEQSPKMSGFPAIDPGTVNRALSRASCAGTVTRAPVLARHNGYSGHPVLLCDSINKLGAAIFWSRSNEAGNRLLAEVSYVGGEALPIKGSEFNPENGANSYVVDRRTSDGRHDCKLVKPNHGVSPLIRANCQRK